jgi:hypothetical protein
VEIFEECFKNSMWFGANKPTYRLTVNHNRVVWGGSPSLALIRKFARAYLWVVQEVVEALNIQGLQSHIVQLLH